MTLPDMSLIGLVTALKPSADGSAPNPMNVLGAIMAYKAAQGSPVGGGPAGTYPVGTAYTGPPSEAISAYSMLKNGGLPAGFAPSDLRTRHGDTLAAPAMRSLAQAARATGIDPWQYIGQGYRSYDQQVNAYANKPGLAAQPGHSLHQLGLAMDASGLPSVLRNYLLDNGWYQFDPVKEPWHYSYNFVG
jgi:hypothetical protein